MAPNGTYKGWTESGRLSGSVLMTPGKKGEAGLHRSQLGTT